MNLGGLLAGLGNESSGSVIENNKTVLIVAVIVLIVFGFGYGRNMFGGSGFEGSVNYGGAADYGAFNPENSKNKKNKHKGHKRHGHDQHKDDYDDPDYHGINHHDNPGMGGSPDMTSPFGSIGLGGPGGMDIPPEMAFRP